MKFFLISFFVISSFISSNVFAEYTRANKDMVEIDSIYTNEWGSPFVKFKTAINTVCGGGDSMYLYNMEIVENDTSAVVWELRRAKLSIALAAQVAGKTVAVDYFYDSTKTGWSACYIHGLTIK